MEAWGGGLKAGEGELHGCAVVLENSIGVLRRGFSPAGYLPRATTTAEKRPGCRRHSHAPVVSALLSLSFCRLSFFPASQRHDTVALTCTPRLFYSLFRRVPFDNAWASQALCGVAAGCTKTSITSHFALRANMADISAKENAQETAVNVCGMVSLHINYLVPCVEPAGPPENTPTHSIGFAAGCATAVVDFVCLLSPRVMLFSLPFVTTSPLEIAVGRVSSFPVAMNILDIELAPNLLFYFFARITRRHFPTLCLCVCLVFAHVNISFLGSRWRLT